MKWSADSAETAAPKLQNRSRITNNPLRRADGRTSAGRRVRDLYRSFIRHVGNPTDDTTRTAVLTAAELVATAEVGRAKLLAGQGDIEQLVRLQNVAERAVKRLGIRSTEVPPLTIRQQLIREAEAREASDA